MNMDIGRKIEEIRQKPEEIRMRYVWGCVAVSMFFVLIIWSFSFRSPDNSFDGSAFNLTAEQRQVFNDFGKEKESLEQAGENVKKVIEKNQEKSPETQDSQSKEGFSGEAVSRESVWR